MIYHRDTEGTERMDRPNRENPKKRNAKVALLAFSQLCIFAIFRRSAFSVYSVSLW